MTTMHGALTGADNMHVPYAWTFANQAAREAGVGVDASGVGKLARQLDDDSLWMLVGIDPVTWKAAGGGSSFPSGTRMLFVQTTAPTGWTKSAVHNDKTLRVVSGTAGSGGSVAFSTVFGRTATDAHTLTTAQMPSHSHSSGVRTYGTGAPSQGALSNSSGTLITTGSAGSGSAHSHNINMRVQYVDVIIATKD